MNNVFSKIKIRFIFVDFLFVTLLLTLIYAVVINIVLNIFNIENADSALELADNEILFLILYFLGVNLICIINIYKLKKNQIEIKDIFGNISLQKVPWMLVLILLFASECLFTGSSQIVIFISHIIAPGFAQSTLKNLSDHYYLHTENIVITILYLFAYFSSVIIIAPIAEEFIFRGIIFHRLATKWNVLSGIILSSFLFGLMHGDILILSKIGFAIVATIAYLISKKLIVPILLHVIHNSLLFLYEIAPNLSLLKDIGVWDEITGKYFIFGLINIIISSVILYLCWTKADSPQKLPYFYNSESIRNQ